MKILDHGFVELVEREPAGSSKDWLCTAALVMAVERLTTSLDRMNRLLTQLEEREPS